MKRKSEEKEAQKSSTSINLSKPELYSIKLGECKTRLLLIVGFFIIYLLGIITKIYSAEGISHAIILIGAFYFINNILIWFFVKRMGKVNIVIHYLTLFLDIIVTWAIIFFTGKLDSPFFIFIYIFVFSVALRYSLKDGIFFSLLGISIVLSMIAIGYFEHSLTFIRLYNGTIFIASIFVIALVSIFLSHSNKKILGRMKIKDTQLEDILNEMRYQQTEIEETNIVMNKIIQKQKATQKDLNTRIQELSLILDITHQLHSILDIEELFNLFIEKIKNFITYSDIEIYLLNDDNITYRAIKEFGSLKVDFTRKDNIIISNDYIKEIVQVRDSIFINDVQHAKITLNKTIKGKKIRSMVYSPLFVPDKLIGFIKLAFFNLPKKIQTLLPTLNILSNIFAQSIENNLLFENQKLFNLKFQTDLKLAHDIQIKIIPEKYPKVNHFEFGAQYIPSRQIGGDYYDFIDLGNNKMGIIISDISGHGVGAAMVMSMVKSFVFNYFRNINSPKKALELINQEINKYILEEDYLTIFYGILNSKTGEFIYSNGGHTQPYYYDFSSDEISELKVSGSLIGIFDNINLDEKSLTFDKGDFIFMYTDGIPDNRNKFDENFGKNRLTDIINQNKFLSADDLCASVIDSHLAFVGDMKMKDDISLVVLKRLPEILFERTWEISSDLKNIKALITEFEEIFSSEKILEKDIYNLKLLLTEAIINAIIHGNKSNLESFVNIDIAITTGSFTAKITDEGEGFDYSEFINKNISPETIYIESGRGLYLIMGIADNIRFNSSGNSITITKKISRKI